MHYDIKLRAVPAPLIATLLRLLNSDLRDGPRDLSLWDREADWWPHLKHHDIVHEVEQALPAEWKVGQLCDPQLLVSLPLANPRERIDLSYHLDQPPPWAEGREYRAIVGVALTRWDAIRGSLNIPGYGPLWLNPGDAVMMDGKTRHSPQPNRGTLWRYAVYYRYLEP